ncbi:helix-turn-helix domain-containing protein [Tomitella biformata]|uniref:helix-turn-helix domain-containing protein n=1 Tax=Tomitella biformata TaxID=630403 RepID=UPI000465CF32|nr:helix-turn-helix domain-containing protein [Tomitella biformata]
MASSDEPPTRAKAVNLSSADKDGKASLSGTQFLTVAEVASMMRVSKMTVYRLLHNGDMPSVRVGRSFRVPAEAVHEYLQTSYFDAG